MKTGIFCVEGEWDRNIRHRSSVRLLVEFLSAANRMPHPIYRRTATREEFKRQVGKWLKTKSHGVGYFAFHGMKGALSLDDDKTEITLDELGEILEGKCGGRHLVFGSCKTLAIDKG